MLTRLLWASVHVSLGLVLGLGLLEVVLQVNPTLLLRGMPVAASLDSAVSEQTYTVRYSDGDAFLWRPDLVAPLTPATNRVEAVVTLQTDEFGFRNPPPLPQTAGVVVLGRSTSLGAQMAHPWPELLEADLGWRVINLAEPGGGLDTRRTIWRAYGQPRQPRWLVLEVAPRIDVSDTAAPATRLQASVAPIVQGTARRLAGDQLAPLPVNPIFPLSVDLPAGQARLVCCLHYMDFQSLDAAAIAASRQWAHYRAGVLSLAAEARASGACLALLYATSKEELYFELARNPEQLATVLAEVTPLHLNPAGDLAPDAGARSDPWVVQQHALAGHAVVAAFAREAGLAFIDPTAALRASLNAGADPFMAYDSHWNALGHALVAQTAAQVLPFTPCP